MQAHADQASGISIHPAPPSDMRAVRMLLPECFAPRVAPEALLALTADGAPAGAACIAWGDAGDPPGFPLAVHVAPLWRGRGIGRALVNAAAALARGEARALCPWSAPEQDSDAAKFCTATGFATHHRAFRFLCDAAALEAAIAGYRQRLDAAGWIPAGARIVTIAEAPADAVAHLLMREFRASANAMRARLRGGGELPYDPCLSVVLLVDETVMGAQLVSIAADGVPEVEANVVHPSLRRGWANLLLTHEGTRRSVAAGTGQFRFTCDERVLDTLKLARRAGATMTGTSLAMLRAMAA